MRQKLLFILVTIIFLLFRICVNAQTSGNTGSSLYTKLEEMDSVIFANVYTCNRAKNETFFTDDIEFYHDKGGVTKSRKALVDQLQNNFCGEGKTKLRRELIKGSMQVYPIDNYGAVQLGDHRFYITENGKESLSGVAKFIHLWKYENGEWRISRVFSLDHNAPGAASSVTSGELYQTIASQDSSLFAAYNARDIEQIKTFFSSDLEFYRDESGLVNYEELMENFGKMFAQNRGNTRTLVPGSMKVYPINNVGALEIGEHLFCRAENSDVHGSMGKNACGTVSFVILWENRDGRWKVSRVIDYNHNH